MLKKWEDLPEFLRCAEVKEYYEILEKKRISLVVKRISDIVLSLLLIIVLSVPMIIVSIAIVIESPGGVFYRQERVTKYGKKFRIFKFRTMVADADLMGSHVTVDNDNRITKIGKVIRNYRIDEIPQLINVFLGQMSFVGTRPEAVRYVDAYTKEMNATLLLPAGITSEASIRFKDEALLLSKNNNPDRIYVEKILPQKMFYNLVSIKKFSLWTDFLTMIRTVFAVLGKEYI